MLVSRERVGICAEPALEATLLACQLAAGTGNRSGDLVVQTTQFCIGQERCIEAREPGPVWYR